MLLIPFTLSDTLLEGEIAVMNRTQCKLFIEFWLRNGVLFYDGGEIGVSKVLKSFFKYNKTLMQLYQKSHEKLRKRSLGEYPLNLEDFNSLQEIKESFPEIREILVEDNINNGALRPPVDQSLHDPELEMEVARISEVAVCELYEKAKSRSETNIEEGEDIAGIWESRFSQLADISKRVSIVDRFCATESPDCPGLKYLLRKLCIAYTHKSMVTVYSAHSHTKSGSERYSPEDVAGNMNRIRGELKDEFNGNLGNIRELRLVCAPNRTFETRAADRYIRFDHTILEVGHGTKLFSQGYHGGNNPNNREGDNPEDEGTAGYSNQFTRKILGKYHRNVERILTESAQKAGNFKIYSNHLD
jgi:hypothetical protein